MDGQEFIIAAIAIIAGTSLAAFIFGNIFKLIRSWINRDRGGYDEETFDRLAKAFIQHKKETERRLQNIEAIIADEEPASQKSIEAPHKEIEIEEDREEQKSKKDDGNLKNMLRN